MEDETGIFTCKKFFLYNISLFLKFLINENILILMERKVIKSVNDLEVYVLAYSLALEVHNLTKGFPKEELYSLTDQIRRSSRSIPANISE